MENVQKASYLYFNCLINYRFFGNALCLCACNFLFLIGILGNILAIFAFDKGKEKDLGYCIHKLKNKDLLIDNLLKSLERKR